MATLGSWLGLPKCSETGSKMGSKWVQNGYQNGSEAGPKWIPKWSREGVKVFTYAAAKSEHFRAFALHYSKMDSKLDSKMVYNFICLGSCAGIM